MGRFRNTSLSYKKSKKSKSREKKTGTFAEEKKVNLKESDKGSWYEQEDWFPENLSSESSADCSESEDDEKLSENDFTKPAFNQALRKFLSIEPIKKGHKLMRYYGCYFQKGISPFVLKCYFNVKELSDFYFCCYISSTKFLTFVKDGLYFRSVLFCYLSHLVVYL